MQKTVAFIPVRGGSKSIPGKNIKPLAGKPLVYWTAKAASDCSEIDQVYVATDDELIASTVLNLGLPKVQVIGRSAETATDTASTESALIEFAAKYECDRIVLIQATSPLLTSADLDAAIGHFERIGCDTLLSTVEQKRFIWAEATTGEATPINYDPMKRPRRQDFEGYLVENGAFYIMRRTGLLSSGNRLHGKIATWRMAPSTFVEIDEPLDWELVEAELKKRSALSADLKQRLSKIKLVLTDVDGVLTDAGMYYSENGDEVKKFNTRDGKGFELLRNAGIRTGIITSENTQLVARRSKKLKVDYLYQGAIDKMPSLCEAMYASGCSSHEVAYLGDDLADYLIFPKVGVSACPADAVGLCLREADIVLSAKGGGGVFREFVELIMDSRA